MGLLLLTGKSEKKGALETGSGVSLSQAAAACCLPGCKSPWDPESLGGNKRFMPGKVHGHAPQ